MMNRKLGKVAVVFIMLVFTGACASIKSQYEEQLPVKPGTEIQVNITADIPLNKARVYSQKGRIIAISDINRDDVFCSVLMNSLQKENGMKLSIMPGKFRVTQVRLSNDEHYAPRIFASRKWVYDPPSNINYETELRLQSAEQPEVRALICVRQIDAYGNHYPRLADFKNALGALVKFNE
jgi:hypothetical protein